MLEINYWAMLLATVIIFVLGALWYSVIFGKLWMKIMGTENYTKEELAKMEKEMIPAYIAQFVTTFIFTFVLASNITFNNLGAEMAITPYIFAFFMWFGYMLTTQISAVLWSQTKKKYWVKHVAVSASYQLVSIMIATFILTVWK